MKVDKALLLLEPFDPNNSCFCYPMGRSSNCFLPDFGETVFACNPESCADSYVYPLAGSFEDFLRLILACGSPNPPEQLAETFSLTPMEDSYSYGKALQLSFDYAQIPCSDESYETLGIER